MSVPITEQDELDVTLNRIANSLDERGYVPEPGELYALNRGNNREIIAGREPFTRRRFVFFSDDGIYGSACLWTYTLTDAGAARVRMLREASEDA